MATKKCVYVLSETDGAKYKLVMQGDVQLLTAKKIKRYLEKATGLPSKDLVIRFNDLMIRDDMDGHDIGLYDGAVLQLRTPSKTDAPGSSQAYTTGSASASTLSSRRDPNVQLSGVKSRGDSVRCGDAKDATPRGDKSAPTSLFARSATAGRHTREVQLSPAAGAAAPTISPVSSQAARRTSRGSLQAENDGDNHDDRVGSPDVDARLYDNRYPSLSMPRTIVQGALPPYDDNACASRSLSHSGSHTTGAGEDEVQRGSAAHGTAAHAAPTSTREDMEDELEALRDENETLRNMLYDAERRAATATSDARLEEALQCLQAELDEARASVDDERRAAVEEAASHFAEKERAMQTEMTRLRREVQQLQREAAQKETAQQSTSETLRTELSTTKRELDTCRSALKEAAARAAVDPKASHAAKNNAPAYPAATASVEALTSTALRILARTLNVDAIELDESHTAVVFVDDELNILVTLDPTSGRLFLYATLLSELPEASSRRLKLYEAILEGALLGKDMSGASVGISQESNLVLISTWIDVRFCNPAAFTAMTQPFCEAVRYWIAQAEQIAYT